jgi:hypothetical protein
MVKVFREDDSQLDFTFLESIFKVMESRRFYNFKVPASLYFVDELAAGHIFRVVNDNNPRVFNFVG